MDAAETSGVHSSKAVLVRRVTFSRKRTVGSFHSDREVSKAGQTLCDFWVGTTSRTPSRTSAISTHSWRPGSHGPLMWTWCCLDIAAELCL